MNKPFNLKSRSDLALLLNIETSSNICSVCVSRNGEVIGLHEEEGLNHASLLTVFIDEVIKKSKITYAELDAVAISAGPGSYTGLRIGVATAKGICYGTSLPLITVDSLHALAQGMMKKAKDAQAIYLSAVDARRNEIYFGIYAEGKVLKEPSAMILSDEFQKNFTKEKKVIVGGSGGLKCLPFLSSEKNFLTEIQPSSVNMISLAESNWQQQLFDNVFTFEPHYIKPVYMTSPNK